LLGLAGIAVESQVLEMAGVAIQNEDSLEAAIRRVVVLADQGHTTGGRLLVRARGVPAGLGEPVFGKLSAELAAAMLSIGSVKAFEMGAGCEHAGFTGEQSNDELGLADGRPTFLTNRAGGVLGGISNGMDLVAMLTVKPTPSIPLPQRTVDLSNGTETRIRIEGRFDSNITPRVAVVGESMMALLLADHMLRSGLFDPTQVARSACLVRSPARPSAGSPSPRATLGRAGRARSGARSGKRATSKPREATR
jgi:chorismate synthase